MNRLIFTFPCLLLFFQLSGQSPLDAYKSKKLYPFYYGVASGDPLQDRVILWTKLEIDSAAETLEIYWQIAHDTAFQNVINSGMVLSYATDDYTVKIDAKGLESNSWYYYRFRYKDKYSLTGRTRTLPRPGETESVRLAVASCQDYEFGYYNAYKSLVSRNEVDALVFLGDYIYEYGSAEKREPTTDYRKRRVRFNIPENEIIDLEDYRSRYRLYRLDPDLREAHRQFPWISVWDDHEHANDSWRIGAQNHSPDEEGAWEDRLKNSVKAYHEWLPIRLPDERHPLKIYRNFEFGELFNLIMLDTRIIGRDEPVFDRLSIDDFFLNKQGRNLLGTEQLNWLDSTLASSKSEWTIIGQQIMMSPLLIKIPFSKTKIGNDDQWDGYPQARKRLFKLLEKHRIQNFVVLSGDIHTAISSHLPKSIFSRGIGSYNYGVEFIAPSITSRNLNKRMLLFETLTRIVNPNIKYIDVGAHGYFVLDIQKERVQADYVLVDRIKTKTFKERKIKSLKVENGRMRLKRSKTEAVPISNNPVLAP